MTSASHLARGKCSAREGNAKRGRQIQRVLSPTRSAAWKSIYNQEQGFMAPGKWSIFSVESCVRRPDPGPDAESGMSLQSAIRHEPGVLTDSSPGPRRKSHDKLLLRAE